jgi:MoaA/NifB/PqqE/SkfB family radical SAM enzyme
MGNMKIQFESTTDCNASCTFCPRYDMTRPRGEMSDGLFHKIVREGQEFDHAYYHPYLNGEPFVFPRIWEWLDYMEALGLEVHLSTNAELMDVGRLVKYKCIHSVGCSINAATKETYDQVVRGPDYDRVVANVDELIEKAPFKVMVSMVVVEENKHEVGLFRRRWGRRAGLGEFKNWTGDRRNGLERTGKRIPCWGLHRTMNILWDGRVVACCMDYDGKLVLGDVNQHSLIEIYHRANWVRKRNRELDFSLPSCKECNHNIEPERKFWHKFLED